MFAMKIMDINFLFIVGPLKSDNIESVSHKINLGVFLWAIKNIILSNNEIFL